MMRALPGMFVGLVGIVCLAHCGGDANGANAGSPSSVDAGGDSSSGNPGDGGNEVGDGDGGRGGDSGVPGVTGVTFTGPAVTMASDCSTAFKVSLSGPGGAPRAGSSAVTVMLTNVVAGSTFSDAACTIAITDLLVAAGAADGTFYVKTERLYDRSLSASVGAVSGTAHHINARKSLLGIHNNSGSDPELYFLTQNRLERIIFTSPAAPTSVLDATVPGGTKIMLGGGGSTSVFATLTGIYELGVAAQTATQRIMGTPSLVFGHIGNNALCAVVAGTISCWGPAGTGSGVPAPVTGISGEVQDADIYVSGNRACAVVDGGVRCWAGTGAAAVIAGLDTNVTRIQVTSGRVCGVKAKKLVCVAFADSSVTTNPDLADIVWLGRAGFASSDVYAMRESGALTALTYDAALTRWDVVGDVTPKLAFDEVAAGITLAAVTGALRACGRVGADVYCWGSDRAATKNTSIPPLY